MTRMLPPCLHRVDLAHAVLALGDLLEVAQARDIALQRLPPCPGAGSGQRVGGLHDHRLDGARLDLVVVGFDRVRHRLWLLEAAGEAGANLGVGAVHLVAHRLADVVQQRPASGDLGRGPQLVGHQRGQMRALDQVIEHVLAVAWFGSAGVPAAAQSPGGPR